MEQEFEFKPKEKDLGKTWMLTNGTLLANIDLPTQASIIEEAEFSYLYFVDIAAVLGSLYRPSGMIIEKQDHTLIVGDFVADHGVLATAEGEWIEKNSVCFDYGITRIESYSQG